METLKHRGLRQFTGDEASNIFLGQTGFDVCTTGETTKSNGFWVAIKVLTAATSIEARSLVGDDLTSDGAAYDGSSGIACAQGDIIYGAFDKVDVTGASKVVICYRGK